MASTLLHPVDLKPIQAPRTAPRIGQMAGLAALVLGVLMLGLALG